MHDNYLQENKMNIIFDGPEADKLREKYTLLELDTFRFVPSGQVHIAFAVIENIPIDELFRLSFQKDLHSNLMENYCKGDWNFCEQAIEQLVGAFGGELDSFYAELNNRINNYKDNDPGENWDYMLERTDPPQS
jgi:hypothetical protein